MITVTRDGAPVSVPQISEEQRETLWAAVFRAYLQRHPEEADTGGQAAAEASTSPA